MKLSKKKDKKDKKSKKIEDIKKKINVMLINYFYWFIVLCVLLIFVAGYLLLIEPKYKEVIQIVDSSRKEEEIIYLDKSRYLQELNNLIEVYEDINQSDKDKVKLLLPELKVPEELLTQLSGIFSQNGLLSTGLSLSIQSEKDTAANETSTARRRRQTSAQQEIKDSTPEGIGKASVSTTIVGVDYAGLKNLLNILENSLRLIDVTSLSFSPQSESVSLNFNTYFLEGLSED